MSDTSLVARSTVSDDVALTEMLDSEP